MALVPGVNEYLKHCEEHDVEVFSVTNRDQGPDTLDLALKQRQYLGRTENIQASSRTLLTKHLRETVLAKRMS